MVAHLPYQGERRRLRAVLGLTVAIMLVQLVGAWYSGSLALFSDTGHVLVDFLGLGAAYMALCVVMYPLRSGSRFTYGLHRVEVLVAIGNSLLLLAVCALIAWEAVQRVVNPRGVVLAPMLISAVLGLIGNAIAVWLLHRGQTLSTRAAYLHALSDMASSVAVVGGGIGMWWTGALWIDPVLSLVLVGFIVRHAFLLLWESLGVVLEASPSALSPVNVEDALCRIPGVSGVHDLHIWRITPKEMVLSAHLVIEPGIPQDAVLASARQLLQERFGVHHVALQIESSEMAEQWQCIQCRYTTPLGS